MIQLPPARLLFLFSLLLLVACTNKTTLFTPLAPDESGIHFINTVSDNTHDQSLVSEFSFMGGGVGIGDFNNDGLPDVFFSANQSSSRLYINRGDNRFEDITEQAGVATQVWATGVSVVDINGDGYDDIYVSVFGKDLQHRAPNLLFINQHNLRFTEAAAAYGLADMGYSTQAAFFDYDRDGDLDMYLLNYRLGGNNANSIATKDLRGSSPANDRLYRNDGDPDGKGHPHFSDVSREAGILEDGYGLGVAITDVNNDGWPDVYVSNDFVSNDELWLNNHHGGFTDCIARSIMHQGYSSMGADAADINNDGLPDIATLDMMPEFNDRKKLSYSFMNYERYQLERASGYEPEFARNMLQLNQGTQQHGDTALPFFSEIGQLAGISETDWSWSVLMADFNNDGWKDMHITNGIGRDYINADFIQYSNNLPPTYSEAERRAALNKQLKSIEPVMLGNYLYLNNRNYTFSDCSAGAGVDEPSLSNGAAYADLDGDGDQDLVVNNINQQAFVLINNTVQKQKASPTHALRIALQGSGLNRQGLGSKVYVYAGSQVQLQEESPVRGYLSSVDKTLLFGLGNHAVVDSVIVLWPDGRKEIRRVVKADTLIRFNQSQAIDTAASSPSPTTPLFTDITGTAHLYKHLDVPMNDFAQQRLLPQKFSQLGPFLTTGDINGDGLMDFFVGGGFNSTGKIVLQKPDGSMQATDFPLKDPMREDADCLLFDADGDGDNDLLITYGDMRYDDTSSYYTPILYNNDGKGHFTAAPHAIPSQVKTIAGCVRTADYDGDGDQDIFIGGRVSKRYPEAPRSFLLQNNRGVFTDVTAQVCPQLERAGMISSAVWQDMDHDGQPELILAGDWMALRFFCLRGGKYMETTGETGLAANRGMWRSLIAADVDGDGDPDLVAGNLGMNCKYHVSAQQPMMLYAKDLDANGSLDPIPFYYIRDKQGKRLYPAVSRDALAEQVPAVKKEFLEHTTYAAALFDDLFKNKEGLLELTCEETAHCWFENRGKGKFIRHLLPIETQFAPVNAIICNDLDGDGRADLLLAGNEYQTEVMTGRYDASYGLFLKGTKTGFMAVPPIQSGFIVRGDVKSMAVMSNKHTEKRVIVGINNDSLRILYTHPVFAH